MLHFSIRGGLLRLAALTMVACADISPDEQGGDQEPSALQASPKPDQTTIRSVTPVGLGCRPGTWHSEISTDGLVFTVTFSDYAIYLRQNEADKSLDCKLTILFNVPSGYTQAVAAFSYQGYAHLERGVTASQRASYQWTGRPFAIREATRSATGPFHETYAVVDPVALRTLPDWLPCDGRERRLEVGTSLTLTNGTLAKGNGYINTSSIDLDVATQKKPAFIVKLNEKRCADSRCWPACIASRDVAIAHGIGSGSYE